MYFLPPPCLERTDFFILFEPLAGFIMNVKMNNHLNISS